MEDYDFLMENGMLMLHISQETSPNLLLNTFIHESIHWSIMALEVPIFYLEEGHPPKTMNCLVLDTLFNDH